MDENTPLLMTENEYSKWLGVSIAEVRLMDTAGDYSAPTGATIPLYPRRAVTSEYLPPGWSFVFGITETAVAA